MAKFLQNLTSMNNLPIFIQMKNMCSKCDTIILRHLSIPACKLGMKNYKLRSILNGVAEQKFTQSYTYRNFNTTSFSNKNFYTITFEMASGEKHIVKGKEGDTLLDVVNNNHLEIPGYGACEGTVSCSTCHVILKNEDYKKFDSPLSDEEQDMLTTATDYCDTGKIRCLSLSGSGFLGLYLIGAVEYLQQRYPNLLSNVYYAGSSAGALVASGLACNVPLRSAQIAFLRTAAFAQESSVGVFGSNFYIQDHLRRGLQDLPEDAHLRANGRLFVSLTRVRDFENVIISEWSSREELIETILCSCFIPGVSGTRFPSIDGTLYMDGGFTNSQPTPIRNTLTVCPYQGKAHISPQSEFLNSGKNFYWDQAIYRHYRSVIPSPPHEMMAFYWEGYSDAKSYMNLIKN